MNPLIPKAFFSNLKHLVLYLPFFDNNNHSGFVSNKKDDVKDSKSKDLALEKTSNSPMIKLTLENTTAKWITNKVGGAINNQIFNGFIHGLLPGFRIKEFINSQIAAKIGEDIRGFVEEYKTAPGVGRAGETLVEHSDDFDGYAEYAAILKDPNISIPHRLELADKVVGYLIRNTAYQFKPLERKGVEFFYGLFRQINTGAGWHLDDVTKDSNVFSTRKSIFQGSAVLHIKTPKTGGETIIANRKAQPGDYEFLNEDGWTYDDKMFKDVLLAEVPCVAGDLVFLSTHNYHMVKPCLEVSAERISFSMFFVVFADEPNIFYYYN